jgi:hypothetical protein
VGELVHHLGHLSRGTVEHAGDAEAEGRYGSDLAGYPGQFLGKLDELAARSCRCVGDVPGPTPRVGVGADVNEGSADVCPV